jgi:glycyl-tRNA synthetase
VARTYLFLTTCGINPQGIRFRQHRSDEMAHYAQDCWDAEVETSYGWIEVAGHADRSAYDLTKHSERTKVELVAARPFKEPKTVKYVWMAIDKPKMGKALKKDSKLVTDYLDNVTEEDKERMMKEMSENGKIIVKVDDKEVEVSGEFIQFEEKEKIVDEEKYIPSVIEPSFGIGRILYCIMEHCFKMREHDAQRTYFTFPAVIAPVKCCILPLINSPDLNKAAQDLKTLLNKSNLSSKIDDSKVNVGKRYARTDECGIPYAFTIDPETITTQTVTMRDLDTMKQIRLPIAETPALLGDLVLGNTTWADALAKYPNVEAKNDE